MSLPREFYLIDRMIHLDEELHLILEQSDTLMFAMKKDVAENGIRWMNEMVNYSPLLSVKVGDILKYRGIKIHVVE